MRSSAVLRCASKVWFGALFALLFAARTLYAQGGEPQDFAIRGAKVVPVSRAPLENATVVISRGIITAVGKEANIPAEAWVIDGKGLTVYPGLFDSFTDVGIPAALPAGAEGAPRRPQEAARGPEDRPGSTAWRSAADEVSLSDKRIETWRSAGFTTVVSAPKGGFFPGQAAVLDLAGGRARDLVVKSPIAIPLSWQLSEGFRGGFPNKSRGRSPARSSTAACPGKNPPLGAETTVVNPALRHVSMRLSLRLTSSAALRHGVEPGRSSGPRAASCGRRGAPSAPAGGAAGMPTSVKESKRPG